MATSHYCHGKWRDGPVSSCPKHKKLSQKQSPVVAKAEHRGGYKGGGSSSGGSSGSSGSSSSSSSASSSAD